MDDKRYKIARYDSPLIRDEKSSSPRPVGLNKSGKSFTTLYLKAGLKPHKGRMYELRTHSLRKYLKTQLTALGVNSKYIEYMMGHTISTYRDI